MASVGARWEVDFSDTDRGWQPLLRDQAQAAEEAYAEEADSVCYGSAEAPYELTFDRATGYHEQINLTTGGSRGVRRYSAADVSSLVEMGFCNCNRAKCTDTLVAVGGDLDAAIAALALLDSDSPFPPHQTVKSSATPTLHTIPPQLIGATGQSMDQGPEKAATFRGRHGTGEVPRPSAPPGPPIPRPSAPPIPPSRRPAVASSEAASAARAAEAWEDEKRQHAVGREWVVTAPTSSIASEAAGDTGLQQRDAADRHRTSELRSAGDVESRTTGSSGHGYFLLHADSDTTMFWGSKPRMRVVFRHPAEAGKVSVEVNPNEPYSLRPGAFDVSVSFRHRQPFASGSCMQTAVRAYCRDVNTFYHHGGDEAFQFFPSDPSEFDSAAVAKNPLRVEFWYSASEGEDPSGEGRITQVTQTVRTNGITSFASLRSVADGRGTGYDGGCGSFKRDQGALAKGYQKPIAALVVNRSTRYSLEALVFTGVGLSAMQSKHVHRIVLGPGRSDVLSLPDHTYGEFRLYVGVVGAAGPPGTTHVGRRAGSGGFVPFEDDVMAVIEVSMGAGGAITVSPASNSSRLAIGARVSDVELRWLRELDDSDDCYKVLRCGRGADAAGLKEAFNARARELHPDKGGSNDLMVQLGIAYATLSDPVARRKHDALLNAKKCWHSDPEFWRQLWSDGRWKYVLGGIVFVCTGIVVLFATSGVGVGIAGGAALGAGLSSTTYAQSEEGARDIIDGTHVFHKTLLKKGAVGAVCHGLACATIGAVTVAGAFSGAGAYGSHAASSAVSGAAWGTAATVTGGVNSGNYGRMTLTAIAGSVGAAVIGGASAGALAGVAAGGVMHRVGHATASKAGPKIAIKALDGTVEHVAQHEIIRPLLRPMSHGEVPRQRVASAPSSTAATEANADRLFKAGASARST